MRVFAAILAAVVVLVSCSGTEQAKGSKGADFFYSLSVNLYYDQDAQGALRELTTCLAKDPNHVKGHHLAGLIYMGRKEYVDSQFHFETALKLDPDYHMARANLGALYMAMQQWTRALETLQPLLHESLYPTPYLVENNLGWCHYNLKNYAAAEKHLKRAVFLNDKLCLAYNNLGILHESQGRHLDAHDDFEAALKRCPNYVEAYFRLGALLERKGQYGDASKKYRKCNKLGGESLYGRRCKRKLQVLK